MREGKEREREGGEGGGSVGRCGDKTNVLPWHCTTTYIPAVQQSMV